MATLREKMVAAGYTREELETYLHPLLLDADTEETEEERYGNEEEEIPETGETPAETPGWVVVKAHPREAEALLEFKLWSDYVWPDRLFVRLDVVERVQKRLEEFRRKHFNISYRSAIREYRERQELGEKLRSMEYDFYNDFIYNTDELREWQEAVEGLEDVARDLEESWAEYWIRRGRPWPWRKTIVVGGVEFIVFSYIIQVDGNWIRDLAVWYQRPARPVPVGAIDTWIWRRRR